MDCGPTCLRMVAKHYGKHYSLETLRQKSFIGREGVSMLGISTAAESIGFRSIGVHISFQQLAEAPMPCIVHWKQNHFVVVYDIKIRKNRERHVVGANNHSPLRTSCEGHTTTSKNHRPYHIFFQKFHQFRFAVCGQNSTNTHNILKYRCLPP